MHDQPKLAFLPQSVTLKLKDIQPVKKQPKNFKHSVKYQKIVSSISEIGIIEPPIVHRIKERRGKFVLLDGHQRIQALKQLGIDEVTCLISTDDETFTYNKRINKLAAIQEHKMIMRAIERGVPEQRIAKALDVNVFNIRTKIQLIDGICEEVVNLLKDKHCPIHTFRILKKMKPVRQIEVAELMIDLNNYSTTYANAALAATPKTQLLTEDKPAEIKGLSAGQIQRMETEMAQLQQEMKSIETSYGADHLKLVLVRSYLGKLLENHKVSKYLAKHHLDVSQEFLKIVSDTSLGAREA